MVRPITEAESYVCETGKSMKAVGFAEACRNDWEARHGDDLGEWGIAAADVIVQRAHEGQL